MADKRMFSKTIIDSDAFLDMPMSARLLYYDLSMRADDDGFVNSPKKIMKITGATSDDMNILIMRQFIIPFDSGVMVIKHWRIHNYIRKDTYTPTIYTEEKSMLTINNSKEYEVCLDTRPRLVDDPSTQVNKNRLDKNNIDAHFDAFWKAYPNKKSKQKAHQIFEKINPDDALFEDIMNGLERAKNSSQWKKDNGQFIPHPTTWLNGRRWEDEYDTNGNEERISAIDF